MAEIHTLANNITVILEPDAHAKTVCVLVGVSVGANNESENEHGLAHFFEHMCFKGTTTYPHHRDLLLRMDAAGLVGNAYTGREYTGYYLFGRPERLPDMVEITADIFLHSLFPAEELEKEKGVIVEEIAMYEDDPAAKAGSEVEKALYVGTPVEHDILGTADSVTSFSREDFIRFFSTHYTADNTIISIAGRFSSEDLLEVLRKTYAEAQPAGQTESVPIGTTKPARQHRSIVRSDLEQSHIVIGGYAPALTDTGRYAASVCNAVLGGSMSSRLFLRVREQLGACYTIRSCIEMSARYGTFSIYTGSNGARVREVMQAIAEECARMRQDLVAEDEVAKAVEYLLGVRALRRDSRQHIAMRNMELYALTGTLEEDEEYEKKVRAVSPKEVLAAAQMMLDPQRCSICYVGNAAVPESVTDVFLEQLKG